MGNKLYLTDYDNIQLCRLLYRTRDSLIFQISPETRHQNDTSTYFQRLFRVHKYTFSKNCHISINLQKFFTNTAAEKLYLHGIQFIFAIHETYLHCQVTCRTL